MHDLDARIDAVPADDLPALHRFVHDLRKDNEAVLAGLTPTHSNGPTEGVVNKIKLLKRQPCGWASSILLRKQILLASSNGRGSSPTRLRSLITQSATEPLVLQSLTGSQPSLGA
ncbi:transposase [Actinosynnema sp. NPDC023658]|uniref:transposase n=1 Tax=Actinosynnema sp. NPDC023658 TaxID=3155465 RepID=UPI0033C1E6BE